MKSNLQDKEELIIIGFLYFIYRIVCLTGMGVTEV